MFARHPSHPSWLCLASDSLCFTPYAAQSSAVSGCSMGQSGDQVRPWSVLTPLGITSHKIKTWKHFPHVYPRCLCWLHWRCLTVELRVSPAPPSWFLLWCSTQLNTSLPVPRSLILMMF